MNISEWLKSGAYLPKPLRDFHDAKDVFKTVHTKIDLSKNEYCKDITWTSAQVYVIDIFLWFMAKRGWTLQRSRSKLEFLDLQKDIEERKGREVEAFRAAMESRRPIA